MDVQLQEAIEYVTDTSSNRQFDWGQYRLACLTLVNQRDELTSRVPITVPNLSDPAWDEVKEGSEELCTCGQERVIVPGNQRSEFKPSDTGEITISPGEKLYLKPISGHSSSTYASLEIREGVLTFTMNPFARVFDFNSLFSARGYELSRLAEILSGDPRPPVLMTTDHVPLFAINAVGQDSVTITLDKAVERFDPNQEVEHSHAPE